MTALLLASICVPQADARIVRIVIEDRQSPAYQGRSFGSVGAYQKLVGHFYGELDRRIR